MICQMNVTPMVAAISLECREAMEMLLFESLPPDARLQIDQNQHVHYVHCVTVFVFLCLKVSLFCEAKCPSFSFYRIESHAVILGL